MDIKQIFSAYDFNGNSGVQDLYFCPVCGKQCRQEEEGGRKRPLCPGCGFVQYKNPSPAVSVVVIQDEKVLLGKRAAGSFKAGKWCLPCGFIEFDEDFLTAAIREVREETGLDVEIQSIISVCTNYLSHNLHTLVVVLLAHVADGEAQAGDDLETVKWFPLSGPLPEMAFEADVHIIERYTATRIQGLQVESLFRLD